MMLTPQSPSSAPSEATPVPSQAPLERFAKVESFLFEVGFTCYELAVLTALKNHAPNIRPSIDLLTREAGMSRSKLKATLGSLVAMGAIEVYKRFDGDVTPFIGPSLMRVGGCGHAAAPC